jgi:peptidyl-prolyl cis-trans isomerase D
MLNSFRSLANSITMKILLGLLILSFAIWGIEDMFRSTMTNTHVVTVGDISISQAEFHGHLSNETEKLKQMLGENYSPEIAKQFNLENAVLQRLVHKSLITLEARTLGLSPNDSDVVRYIRTLPMFHDAKGNFSKAQFEAYLRNTRQTEKAYIDSKREEIASGLLMETVIAAPAPSDIAVKTIIASNHESRNISLYTLGSSVVGTLPTPTDAELEAFHKEHGQAFTAPELRTISYVTIAEKDVKKVAKPSDEEIETVYNQRIDEFKRPEQREVEQLLFGNEEAAKKAHDELTAGTDFAKVKATSNLLNKSNTSLGFVQKDNMLDVASDTVFTLAKGGFSAPIKSPFGWHIFRVNNIKAASTVPLAEARASLEKDLSHVSADNALSDLANKLEDAIGGGSSLAEAAKELGLKMETLPAITRKGEQANGEQLKNLPTLDKFIETAFKTEEKTESSLINSKGGIYYILRVDALSPEHIRPLSEVKTKVTQEWKNAQRNEKLAAITKEVNDAFAKPETRAAVISKYKLSATEKTVQRTSGGKDADGLSAEFIDKVFMAAPGTATAPHVQGEQVLIAVVNRIAQQAARQTSQKELNEVREELTRKMRDEVSAQYLRHLATKYPVKVNEEALVRQAGNE